MQSIPSAFKLTLVALTLCAVSCRHLPWTAQAAHDHLTKIECFAFGGVGLVPRTSAGELAFRTILRDGKGAELFRSAIAEGTDEAKLYALCGIRLLDRGSFDACAEPLLKVDSDATTMSGCVIERKKVAAIVHQISNGDYDPYLNKIKR